MTPPANNQKTPSTTIPRDDKGHAISRDCQRCGYGKLQYEGGGFWKCDGLEDPEDDRLPLRECSYSHMDGAPYKP